MNLTPPVPSRFSAYASDNGLDPVLEVDPGTVGHHQRRGLHIEEGQFN